MKDGLEIDDESARSRLASFSLGGVLGLMMILSSTSWSRPAPPLKAQGPQVLPPSPSCFVRPTYAMSDVEIHRDIRYGGAINPYSGQFHPLLLDFYHSRVDGRAQRPAVVLLHGGYLVSGDKASDSMPQLATVLAQRGYAVVSINYRKAPASVLSTDLMQFDPAQAVRIVEMVQEDARAAVRFLRRMAQAWRIDVNRILVGGDSAGAVAALYYGYVEKAPEGSSGNPGFSSTIHAVLAISGTLRAEAYCDSVTQDLLALGCKITAPPAPDLTSEISKGDVPMLLWHGGQDTVIPITNAIASMKRAQAVGVPSLLVMIPDGGHVPMAQGLEPTLPYLSRWLSFVAGSLNLTEAQCPQQRGVDLDQPAISV
ncbi:unnamed protein product [Effrenium voratum]|nr:unnamed protein product [Effrenium voratum]